VSDPAIATEAAPEKVYFIPESVLNAVKSYLMSRPYHEVCVGVKMLDGLQALTPVQIEKKE